jgi:hypothetical protein
MSSTETGLVAIETQGIVMVAYQETYTFKNVHSNELVIS